MKNNVQHIEKLADANYEAWKMQMKSILVYNDLYTSEEIGLRRVCEIRIELSQPRDEKALAF